VGGVGEGVEVVAELIDGFGEDGEEAMHLSGWFLSPCAMGWVGTSEESSRLFLVAWLPVDLRRQIRDFELSSSTRSHGDIDG
jgi:hypothetical protein